jgi:hypothetical protein
MSAWNDFVKKIYHEGHNKNPNYSFKQALQDASKRKGEMGSSAATSNKMIKKSRKSKKSKKNMMKGGRKTRKHRKW